MYGAGPGENGQPVEDGEGEKMGSAVIGYCVAAAAHCVFSLLYCDAVGFSTHAAHGYQGVSRGMLWLFWYPCVTWVPCF